MRLPIIVVAILALAACAKAENKPYWSAHCEKIENGSYRMCYGPGIKPNDSYANIHTPAKNLYLYYSVGVDRVDSDRISTVLFERTLAIDEIDPILLDEDYTGVATYDKNSKSVQFDVGKSRISYRIP